MRKEKKSKEVEDESSKDHRPPASASSVFRERIINTLLHCKTRESVLALRLDDRERAWIIKKEREPFSIEVIPIFRPVSIEISRRILATFFYATRERKKTNKKRETRKKEKGKDNDGKRPNEIARSSGGRRRESTRASSLV